MLIVSKTYGKTRHTYPKLVGTGNTEATLVILDIVDHNYLSLTITDHTEPYIIGHVCLCTRHSESYTCPNLIYFNQTWSELVILRQTWPYLAILDHNRTFLTITGLTGLL